MDGSKPPLIGVMVNGKWEFVDSSTLGKDDEVVVESFPQYYPDSDCRNFGVEYMDSKIFWQEKLNCALWFDDGAVDMLQTFQFVVDTSRQALQALCHIDVLPPETLPLIMGLEGESIDSRYAFVYRVEDLLKRKLKKNPRRLLFQAIRPASRIDRYKFLYWYNAATRPPYYEMVYILYEDRGSLFHVLGDITDGVNPPGWWPRRTTMETLLADVVDEDYLNYDGADVFFDTVKVNLKQRFSEITPSP